MFSPCKTPAVAERLMKRHGTCSQQREMPGFFAERARLTGPATGPRCTGRSINRLAPSPLATQRKVPPDGDPILTEAMIRRRCRSQRGLWWRVTLTGSPNAPPCALKTPSIPGRLRRSPRDQCYIACPVRRISGVFQGGGTDAFSPRLANVSSCCPCLHVYFCSRRKWLCHARIQAEHSSPRPRRVEQATCPNRALYCTL